MWRASSHADGSISHAVVHVERGTTEDEIRGWARRELAHIEGLVLQVCSLAPHSAASPCALQPRHALCSLAPHSAAWL